MPLCPATTHAQKMRSGQAKHSLIPKSQTAVQAWSNFFF